MEEGKQGERKESEEDNNERKRYYFSSERNGLYCWRVCIYIRVWGRFIESRLKCARVQVYFCYSITVILLSLLSQCSIYAFGKGYPWLLYDSDTRRIYCYTYGTG